MRRSRIIVLLALLLVGAFGLGGWLADRFWKERDTPVIVFPDGTRAKFLGAVRGGSTFSTEQAWARPLRKILPFSWQSWLPSVINITCGGGTTNDIVVYFGFDTTAGNTSSPWQSVAAEDDDGLRYSTSSSACSSSVGGKQVHGVIINGFPRRQKLFRLNFLDSDYQTVAQTRMPNPLPVPPPEFTWQAEPMPITRTNGELALTLVSAREVTNRWGAHLRPKWQTQALDPRWKNTQIGYLEVADATGNEGGFLSRKEKVWRVSAGFHRQRREDFSASEKMMITNVAVPSVGEMISSAIVQDCGNVRVQFEGVYGPGTLFITNGLQRVMTTNVQTSWGISSDGKTTVERQGSAKHFLLVNATGMAARDELRFRLTDDQGREIPLIDSNTYRYRSSKVARVYQCDFALTNSAPPFSLEIIVSRPREFVFYINPKEVAPPEPMTGAQPRE